MTAQVSKLNAYAVVRRKDVDVSKLNAYAVIRRIEMEASKLVAYAVVTRTYLPPTARSRVTQYLRF